MNMIAIADMMMVSMIAGNTKSATTCTGSTTFLRFLMIFRGLMLLVRDGEYYT